MKIVVMDGQGGRLGKLLVEEVRARLPQAQILAIGTNALATSAMLKAGGGFRRHGREPCNPGRGRRRRSAGPGGHCGGKFHIGGGHPRHGGGGRQLPGEKVSGSHEQLRRDCGRRGGAVSERLCGRRGGGPGPGSEPVA